ncbi:MAG: DUF547 domain-containing protein [Hyphomicrobiaceae bacterium]
MSLMGRNIFRWMRLAGIAMLMGLAVGLTGPAAAGAISETFAKHIQSSSTVVDHSAWDRLLKAYLISGPDGLNQVDYKLFKNKGHAALKTYLTALQAIDVTQLSRPEQFAFWANLYNAKTIDIVLTHYPVKSIRDIDISGLFADGPWGKKVVVVNGVELSLDDIEHKIMRPLFRDPRVHYAVNCASVGCPNLPRDAFTGRMLEDQLTKGAEAYINSRRGVSIMGREATVSKIYRWYGEDFGGDKAGILQHLRKYAQGPLAAKLEAIEDIGDYAYDWSLNDGLIGH